MAERYAFATASSWQAPPRQTADVGTNEPQTARKEYEGEVETRESDHEKVMRHLKLDFSIQLDGLKRENEELQITIDAFHLLFEKIRDKNTAEIQALTQAMQLLWSELYAKDKELRVMYDAHDALVKKLDDERVELPKKLADAAKHALTLQSDALKPSDNAVDANIPALVHNHLYYLHGWLCLDPFLRTPKANLNASHTAPSACDKTGIATAGFHARTARCKASRKAAGELHAKTTRRARARTKSAALHMKERYTSAFTLPKTYGMMGVS